MSRINLGEIYYSIAKDYDDATAAALVQQLTAIFVEIVPVTDADIDAAAKLKAHYRISYADAFCCRAQHPSICGFSNWRSRLLAFGFR